MNTKRKINEAVDPVSKIQALIQQANDAYHNADSEQGGTEYPLMDKHGDIYGLSSDIELNGRGYIIIPFTAPSYSNHSDPVKIKVLSKVGGKIKIFQGDYFEEGWKDASKLLKSIIKDSDIGIGHFKEYDPNWENSDSKEEKTNNKSLLKAMNKKIGRNVSAGMDSVSENLLRKVIRESIKNVFENELPILHGEGNGEVYRDDAFVTDFRDNPNDEPNKVKAPYNSYVWNKNFSKHYPTPESFWNPKDTRAYKYTKDLDKIHKEEDKFKRSEDKKTQRALDAADKRPLHRKGSLNRAFEECVRRNVKEVINETSYDLARNAHKSAIEQGRYKQADRLHGHMTDRISQRFDPNMPVLIVGGDKQGKYTAQDIVDHFDLNGYVEPSQNPLYTDSQVIGYPRIKGYVGPMWDDGKIRYESQDAYDFYSK